MTLHIIRSQIITKIFSFLNSFFDNLWYLLKLKSLIYQVSLLNKHSCDQMLILQT